MKFTPDQIVATVVATSFAAGLNVYATVATLGLLAHLGVLALPPTLGILASWWVIGISSVLFAIEFFADKIPAFDLVWNTLHTFIRVPVAALLAYRATAALSPWEQLAATAAGGLIAFAAHGGKTAARAAVTASPEPFSNAALSLGEDGLAIFLTWFATQHPYSAAAIVVCLLVIIVLLARWVLRALRALFPGDGRGTGRAPVARFTRGQWSVCPELTLLSFRRQLYRRGICFLPAAKQQIPRATGPRFGMTIRRDFQIAPLPVCLVVRGFRSSLLLKSSNHDGEFGVYRRPYCNRRNPLRANGCSGRRRRP